MAEGRGDRVALRSTAGDITYAQLAGNVARCGNALRSLGIGRAELLLMVVRDTPEFFYVFWGAIKAGIVPVSVNTLLKAEDYRYLVEDSACTAVVYTPELEAEVTAGAKTAAGKQAQALSTDAVVALMKTAQDSLVPEQTRSDEDCFWLYSSGSTGKPKGVVHVHRDMVITSERYSAGILGIKAQDVVFSLERAGRGGGRARFFPG